MLLVPEGLIPEETPSYQTTHPKPTAPYNMLNIHASKKLTKDKKYEDGKLNWIARFLRLLCAERFGRVVGLGALMVELADTLL
jgi:hypothetical protein